ncbi:hypothetical protein I4U23_021349 [Adineta vaga]|nr:hypothetical protein I4U23_021349 [Adineta vaga]
MSSKACKCGGTEIDIDRARGVSVCKKCAEVIEDTCIVNEAELTETSGGGIQVVGQWVSNDELRGSGGGGGMMGFNGRESRQITLQKARRGIMDIASNMRMNHHCIDAAFKIYKMALDRGLSRGNKASHLLSACLYIICRTEGTQHILLDFCDHVDADISVLARIYLRLARELCINVPHTDPSLLIPRYAAKLDFGDRTNAVSNTALRIVQRMKRDWLNIGRRSSGLCGSALLFAARMHNFNRTIQQIVDVVKISKATIIRRLQEFEVTPTAQLNMKEFDTIELEEEQDPPAFSKAKRMTKLAQQEETFNIDQIERDIIDTQKQIDEQLEKLHKPRGQLAKYAKYVDLEKDILNTEEDKFIQKVLTTKSDKRKKSLDDDDDDDDESVSGDLLTTETEKLPIDENDLKWAANYIEEQQTQLILSLLDDNGNKATDNNDDSPDLQDEQNKEDDFKFLRPSLETMGIVPVTSSLNYSADNQHATTSSSSTRHHHHHHVVLDFPEWHPSIDLTNEELDLTGIDDNEIEEMILTRDETKLKLKSWLRENKDWFLEEKRRQRNKEAAEQKKSGSSAMTAAQRRKRKKKAATALNELNKTGSNPTGAHHQLGGFTLTPAGLAAAAIEAEKHSQDNRVSSKINYDVLKKLTMKKDTIEQVSSPSVTNTNEAERTT